MKKGLVFIAMFVIGVIAAGIIGTSLWIWHVDRTWSPIIEPRLRERSQIGSVRVLAKTPEGQSRWIGSITAGRMEERQFLEISEIPPQLIQAIVVLEDPRFLQHGGFDVWGIGRAAMVNLLSLRFRQGGSTLTQQLVKNVFLTSERTLKRKITELILSAMIEHRFTKDEILEAYINEIYLGQLGAIEIHGVGRASEYYFNKKVDELDLHEMALVAAMIAGPGVYNPWKAPEKTLQRRNRVLKSLFEAKLILEEEYNDAVAKVLPGKSTFIAPTRAAYLMDAVREHLIQTRTEIEIVKGGFDVQVGLDLGLQELAENSLKERAKGIDPKFQGLIVAADPRTCEIRAYAGGTNYQITQLDRIRLSNRAVGSLMKPLEVTHLLQSDDKLNLAHGLEDRPLEWSYDKGRAKWNPENYDKQFRGMVSLRTTLEESLNIPLIRIFFERFPNGDLSEAFDDARALGLEMPTDRTLPSAVLGAVDQKPLNLLNAYVKLTRRALGLAMDPGDSACRLNFESRTEMLEAPSGNQIPYGQEGARLVIAALEGALRRGTSRSLGAQVPTNQEWAGKTGTSSDSRDAWYVAMSPNLVVLSWSGRDDNQQTKLTGATGAMPLIAPMILAFAKREPMVQGWQWPMPSSVFWKPILKDKFCRPSDVIATLIKSTVSEPRSATPPPQSFKYENVEYIYELFRSGAEPPECL